MVLLPNKAVSQSQVQEFSGCSEEQRPAGKEKSSALPCSLYRILPEGVAQI